MTGRQADERARLLAAQISGLLGELDDTVARLRAILTSPAGDSARAEPGDSGSQEAVTP